VLYKYHRYIFIIHAVPYRGVPRYNSKRRPSAATQQQRRGSAQTTSSSSNYGTLRSSAQLQQLHRSNSQSSLASSVRSVSTIQNGNYNQQQDVQQQQQVAQYQPTNSQTLGRSNSEHVSLANGGGDYGMRKFNPQELQQSVAAPLPFAGDELVILH
jgi:hypothetical protein